MRLNKTKIIYDFSEMQVVIVRFQKKNYEITVSYDVLGSASYGTRYIRSDIFKESFKTLFEEKFRLQRINNEFANSLI